MVDDEICWIMYYKFKLICSIIKDKDVWKYEYENNMDNYIWNFVKEVLIFKLWV